ncbi:MAG: lasso peptide [Cyanobacteria bacterium J06600_6]
MKKTYNTPELTVHGSVNALTQQVTKQLGTTDALGLSVVINADGGTISVGS